MAVQHFYNMYRFESNAALKADRKSCADCSQYPLRDGRLCPSRQKNSGRAAFAYPYEIWAESTDGRRRVDPNEMPLWMEELCAAVTTYYPG